MNLPLFYDTVEDGRLIAFLCDGHTEKVLIEYATETGLSKSAVIRLLLRQAIQLNKTKKK